jgi:hypothetical protein
MILLKIIGLASLLKLVSVQYIDKYCWPGKQGGISRNTNPDENINRFYVFAHPPVIPL